MKIVSSKKKPLKNRMYIAWNNIGRPTAQLVIEVNGQQKVIHGEIDRTTPFKGINLDELNWGEIEDWIRENSQFFNH